MRTVQHKSVHGNNASRPDLSPAPRILGILLLAALFLSSCGTFSISDPDGFARVRKLPASYAAVSPEGFRLKIYSEKNEPRQDLAFWSEAYEHYMTSSGYQPYSDPEIIDTEMGKMYYSQWLVPYDGEHYIYAHGIAVRGDRIFIAEIGGPEKFYGGYRQAILDALGSMK